MALSHDETVAIFVEVDCQTPPERFRPNVLDAFEKSASKLVAVFDPGADSDEE